jgi:hypothetical protein
MPAFTRASGIAAVALVAVVGAAGLLYLNSNTPGGRVGQTIGPPGQTSTTAPTAAATPSATPGITPAPLSGRAGTFPAPFTYTLPAGEGLVLDVSPDDRLYQFREPTPTGDGYDRGIAVRATEGGRVDPCSEQSKPLDLADPQAFAEYFKTIPTVEVSGERSLVIDGRPAIEATLTFQPATESCPDVWLWTESASITQNNDRLPARVTVVDVSGLHVVIVTFGTEPFFSKADDFIASLRFE